MTLAAALVVVSTLSVPPKSGQAAVPTIRLHGAAGWGRPAVESDKVYYLSRNHALLAVNRRDGALAWRQPLGSGTDITAGTRVIAHQGVVIAGDGDLFAFDGSTGEPRWRFGSPAAASVGRYLGDAREGVVYAGSQSGRMFAVDARSGLIRWSSSPLGQRLTVFAPVVQGDRVAAGYTEYGGGERGGGVVLLDAASGALLWQARFPLSRGRTTTFGGGPALLDDDVAAATSDGCLHGFDRTTGKAMWTMTVSESGLRDAMGLGQSTEVTESRSRSESSFANDVEDFRAMAVNGRTLLLTSLAGTLVGLSADTRRELWRYQSPPDGSIAFGLSAHGGTAYVPYASGRTIAVDVASGRERWRIGDSGRRFEWPAAVADGQVYVTSEDGLYVVDDLAH